ncbi:PilZ domain-containing protein [Lysobacter sp. Root494]|uniref:PilZ domain-containing protein n=1 Tax=Lysobacter sp. Root494 TaxID=1736549 RepID=UPI0009EB0431|nr:PilZ domain-containing protein [Lysobacter sp. Root494]
MDAVLATERREGDRVPFASRVMIVRGETAWFAQMLDISTSGCGVFRPDGCVLLEDEIVRLFFYQDGETAAAIVPARVARVSNTRIGIEYHEPQRIPPLHRA